MSDQYMPEPGSDRTAIGRRTRNICLRFAGAGKGQVNDILNAEAIRLPTNNREARRNPPTVPTCYTRLASACAMAGGRRS
jgi:hypothetical protein